MAFIEVKAGGPDIPDGVYPMVLAKIEGPKTVLAQNGPKAGQEIQLLDWTFEVMDGAHDGVEIEASTSMASGPKSKMFAWLTALHGGKAPAVGTKFEVSDLTGKFVLGTIARDDNGWPRITNLGAMPASMLAQNLAKATGAPTTEPPTADPTPVREAVAAGAATDDLPF